MCGDCLGESDPPKWIAVRPMCLCGNGEMKNMPGLTGWRRDKWLEALRKIQHSNDKLRERNLRQQQKRRQQQSAKESFGSQLMSTYTHGSTERMTVLAAMITKAVTEENIKFECKRCGWHNEAIELEACLTAHCTQCGSQNCVFNKYCGCSVSANDSELHDSSEVYKHIGKCPIKHFLIANTNPDRELMTGYYLNTRFILRFMRSVKLYETINRYAERFDISSRDDLYEQYLSYKPALCLDGRKEDRLPGDINDLLLSMKPVRRWLCEQGTDWSEWDRILSGRVVLRGLPPMMKEDYWIGFALYLREEWHMAKDRDVKKGYMLELGDSYGDISAVKKREFEGRMWDLLVPFSDFEVKLQEVLYFWVLFYGGHQFRRVPIQQMMESIPESLRIERTDVNSLLKACAYHSSRREHVHVCVAPRITVWSTSEGPTLFTSSECDSKGMLGLPIPIVTNVSEKTYLTPSLSLIQTDETADMKPAFNVDWTIARAVRCKTLDEYSLETRLLVRKVYKRKHPRRQAEEETPDKRSCIDLSS